MTMFPFRLDSSEPNGIPLERLPTNGHAMGSFSPGITADTDTPIHLPHSFDLEDFFENGAVALHPSPRTARS